MARPPQTEIPSKELERVILALEKLKYQVGDISLELGADLEYQVLVNLRTLHTYLKETDQ
jgi:hypothetical protein